MGKAMKYFLKKLLGHEIFRSMVSWVTRFFLRNLQNPLPLPPSYILIVSSLSIISFEGLRTLLKNKKKSKKKNWWVYISTIIKSFNLKLYFFYATVHFPSNCYQTSALWLLFFNKQMTQLAIRQKLLTFFHGG